MIWIHTPNESSIVSVSISTPKLEKEVTENLSRELCKLEEKLSRRACFIKTSYIDLYSITQESAIKFTITEEAEYGRVTLWGIQLVPDRKNKQGHFFVYFENPPAKVIHSRQYEVCFQCQKQNEIPSNLRLWKNGFVLCSKNIGTGLDETKKGPPQNCPFSAEHLLSLQRVFV